MADIDLFEAMAKAYGLNYTKQIDQTNNNIRLKLQVPENGDGEDDEGNIIDEESFYKIQGYSGFYTVFVYDTSGKFIHVEIG